MPYEGWYPALVHQGRVRGTVIPALHPSFDAPWSRQALLRPGLHEELLGLLRVTTLGVTASSDAWEFDAEALTAGQDSWACITLILNG